MFVSGSLTLPSKTPLTLKIFRILTKNNVKKKTRGQDGLESLT